jgi:signal transduction histidine kinase
MKARLVHRLLLATAVAVAAVLASTWWSLRSLGEAQRAAARLAERSEQALDLTAKLETVVREKSFLADYLLSGDERLLAALRPHREQFRDWIAQMEDFARTDPERALLDRMRTGYAAYTAASDAVVDLERAGRTSDARERFVGMAAQIEQLLADGGQLFTLTAADMRERRSAAEEQVEQGRRIAIWLSGIGALCSLGLAAALARSAARPLSRMVLRLGAAGIGERIAVDGDEVQAIEAHVNALLERVRQQERALHRAEQLSELGEIASELAHETLNPVTGVSAMLQALRRTELAPEHLTRELVEMEQLLGRVARTIRRLMSYARPLEPHVQRVGVEAVVDRALSCVRRTAAGQQHPIRAASAAAGLEWVMDPDLIEQVLVNLLVNGCEASAPGSEVQLRVEQANGALAFVVADQGAGIAPVHRERLFHPFFTTKPDGNGLGLAVSRNIVREHGGTIDVNERAGGGTVFRVVLPRAA